MRSQAEPIRIGLLTIKTGALASGGIDMERGITIFLKEKNYTMGGRKVTLTVADSGGVPAQARTKMQELVERDRVQAVVGPLAAFEALAMDDYIRTAQIPTLPVAGAEDMTQRKANPWFVRATSTSAQCSYPIADYCAKTLKYKRIAAIADDFAYGHELLGGFQKVFEDAGGTLVQKLFSPLNAPDYGSYIAQLKGDIDAVFLGFAGSNGFRFFKQYNEYGMKTPILGGMTAFDEVAVRNMGDYALGAISSCWYTAQLDNPINKRFVAAVPRRKRLRPRPVRFRHVPVRRSAGRGDRVAQGPHRGQADASSRRCAAFASRRCAGRSSSTNTATWSATSISARSRRRTVGWSTHNIYTYRDVSQFWTYDPKEFLKQPVWSRDYPPMKA